MSNQIRYFTTGNICVTTMWGHDGVMVTNISQLTGKMHHLIIDQDFDPFIDSLIKWEEGGLIQDCFPDLTPDDREFIISGITASEWETRFALI